MLRGARLSQARRIGDAAGNGARSGERGTHQMRPSAPPLPILEIAVRCRPTAFAGLQPVGVHADAHRASGLAPVEPRGAQYGVDALRLRLSLDQPRTGDDHRAAVRRDATAAPAVGADTQNREPAVGPTAEDKTAK